MFQDRLGLKHIKSEHIETAHRIGERKADSTRSILAKFLSRETMQQVIQNRRKLKNTKSKVVIVEDLTKSNYSLFMCASDHPGVSRAWTASGKVFLSRTCVPRVVGSRSSQTCSNFPVMPHPSLLPPLPEPLQPNYAAIVGR